MNVVSRKFFDDKFRGLDRRNRMLKKRNSILIKRLGQIVCNQKHYLNKRLKERGGYDQYVKEKERLCKEVANFRQQFGRVHLTSVSRRDGKPNHILMLSNGDARKLRSFLRADHRFRRGRKFIGGGK